MALDIISTINLDLKRPNTETVYAVQYDTAGRIKAQLTNDGEAWHVPSSAGGMVSFRKSDNIGGFYDTTELGEVAVSVDENDDSIIYIALDEQTTTTATPLDHPVQMQINFYNSQGKRLSTFAFYLSVQASVLFEGDQDERPVASEWTFRILTGALGQTIKNQEEAIKWMEDNIRTQEGYVVDDTLKVEGAAGDAKKIGELFEEIVKISDSMPGYFPTTDTARVGNTKYYTRSGTSPNYVYTEFTGATFATGVTYYEYSPWNRIWIDPDDNDVAIPTMDEFDEVKSEISEIIDAPGNIIDYNQSNFKQFTNYVGTYTANSDGFTFSKGESANFQIGLFFPVIVGHTYKLSYHVASGASTQSYVMRNADYPNKRSVYVPEYAYNDNYASESGNDYTVTFTAVTNPECVLAFRISYSAPTDFTLTDLICIDLTENVKVKPEALPLATNVQRGSVVVGNGLDISEEGVLSIDSRITQEINEIETDVDLIETVAVQKVYPVNVLDVSSESFGRSTPGLNWNDSLSITYNDNNGFRATISEYLNLRWWYLFNTQSGKTYDVSCETSGMNSGCTLKIMKNYNAPAYPAEYSEDYVVATLTDDGNGKYIGSFTANSDQYMFVIYKRYDSRDLTVTNVKCTDQTDIERYEMKIADSGSIGGIRIGSGLSIKENGIMSVDKTANIPTKYNGREFCVFNKCLCIGDSLTQGVFNHNEGGSNQTVVISKYSYPSMLTKMSGVETTNLGNGGYTSEEWYGLHENDDLSGHDICIISLGTNDAAKGLSSGTTQSWIQSIITKVKSQNKGIKIFVSNLLPAMKYNTQAYTDVNNYIAAVVQVNTDCYLLDMTQYSVCKRGTSYAQEHLTAIGYRQEAEEIMNYIGYIMQGNKTDFRNVQFAGTNYDWDDD